MTDDVLVIIGASVRAAAFSALRAGLRPWCVDLFADADLRAACPAFRLQGDYPEGFADLIERAPPGPWMYTGGLENWPRLVGRLARRRVLAGNDEVSLRLARDPAEVFRLLRSAGLPTLEVRTGSDTPPRAGSWLRKPLHGSGGSGIHLFDPTQGRLGSGEYLQRFLEGMSVSAIYAGGGRGARFLGATLQLVGQPWLHAQPYRYCGSIGPLPPSYSASSSIEKVGDMLAAGCKLCGLFGIDGICTDGAFYPVEINPRYTASVEVLEHATGIPFLHWHLSRFQAESTPSTASGLPGILGKAIYYAPRTLSIPAVLPWHAASPWEFPRFADIPDPGRQIEAHRPVLSFFARSDSVHGCEGELQRIAASLDRFLADG